MGYRIHKGISSPTTAWSPIRCCPQFLSIWLRNLVAPGAHPGLCTGKAPDWHVSTVCRLPCAHGCGHGPHLHFAATPPWLQNIEHPNAKKLSHSACGSSGLPTVQVKRKEAPVSRNGPEGSHNYMVITNNNICNKWIAKNCGYNYGDIQSYMYNGHT